MSMLKDPLSKSKRRPRVNLMDCVGALTTCMDVYHESYGPFPHGFRERHDQLVMALLDIALYAAKRETERILPKL